MSEEFEHLFRKLEKMMDRVRLALQEDTDPETFKILAEEHEEILRELQLSGTGNNYGLLKRFEMLKSQIAEMMIEIQGYQKELSTRIRKMANGKKMVRAYKT